MNTSTTKKTIVITGANSYLGTHVTDHLADSGNYRIIALVSPRWDKNDKKKGVNYIKADLTSEFTNEIKESLAIADRIFHFAWLRGKNKEDIQQQNNDILKRLLDEVKTKTNFFFISSVSSAPEAKSNYGQTKYQAAKLVGELGANVFTCGLITEKAAEKGAFNMLRNVIKKYPFAVRMNKPTPNVYPIHVDDLTNIIEFAINNSLTAGNYKMFASPVSFNTFLGLIEKEYPKKRMKLAFNTKFILGSTASFKKIGIAPDFILDKVLTFLYKDDKFLQSLKDPKGFEFIQCNGDAFFK